MKHRHAKSFVAHATLKVDGVKVVDYYGRLNSPAFVRRIKKATPSDHVSWAGLTKRRRR